MQTEVQRSMPLTGALRCQSHVLSPAVVGAIRQCNRAEHDDDLHWWAGMTQTEHGRVPSRMEWQE